MNTMTGHTEDDVAYLEEKLEELKRHFQGRGMVIVLAVATTDPVMLVKTGLSAVLGPGPGGRDLQGDVAETIFDFLRRFENLNIVGYREILRGGTPS